MMDILSFLWLDYNNASITYNIEHCCPRNHYCKNRNKNKIIKKKKLKMSMFKMNVRTF